MIFDGHTGLIIEAGVHLVAVQAFMGHEKIEMVAG